MVVVVAAWVGWAEWICDARRRRVVPTKFRGVGWSAGETGRPRSRDEEVAMDVHRSSMKGRGYPTVSLKIEQNLGTEPTVTSLQRGNAADL